MQNLFIDTNVFLSFFYLTSEDLEELRKLSALLKEKRLKLWLPDHVVDEFNRNREAKIQEALKQLRDQRLNLQFPAVCRDYAEYEVLRGLQREYESRHATLIANLEDDVRAKTLRADKVIAELFDAAARIPTDDTLIDRARRRADLGNPPGKPGSIGDAVNWEALLSQVPKGEDLFFVTQDKDYLSPLDGQAFSAFLLSEWDARQSSRLYFYSRLSNFFKDHFPNIELATDVEKDVLITDLANSGSFSRTHTVIAKLSEHTEFTEAQVDRIVDAALSNNQVRWIAVDPDVKALLSMLLERYAPVIEEDKRKKLEKALE